MGAVAAILVLLAIGLAIATFVLMAMAQQKMPGPPKDKMPYAVLRTIGNNKNKPEWRDAWLFQKRAGMALTGTMICMTIFGFISDYLR